MSITNVLGQDIFFEKMGDEGPPMLFIHGVPTSTVQWREIQQNLADVYRTYNIDLIGMGRSAKPLEEWDYNFANDAKIINALLDDWGIDKINLCGDDWGGGIALTFAHNYPERIDRLMVFSPVVYDHWPVPEIEAFGALQNLSDEQLQQNYPDLVAKLSMVLRSMLYKPSILTGLTIREFLEPYRTNNYLEGNFGQPKMEGMRALIKRAAALNPKWMLDLDLSSISVPTLVGWGEEDIYMDPIGMYMLKDDLSGPVRMQLIPEAGHLAMVDRPLEITELIDDFMSEWQVAEELKAA